MPPADFFQCNKCQGFIEDWFSQPLSPKDLLFNDVHRARLKKVIPELIPLFITLIKKLTINELESMSFKIDCNRIQKMAELLYDKEEDVNNSLNKYSWHLLTDLCMTKHPYPVTDIQDVLIDNCVCKNDLHKELIGFYVAALVNLIPEVHGCHLTGAKMS
jgi:hypothetical protein